MRVRNEMAQNSEADIPDEIELEFEDIPGELDNEEDEELREYLEKIYSEADEKSPDDFERERIKQADGDRRLKEKSILKLWIHHEKSERTLRRNVALGLGVLLFLELAVGNTAFMLIGGRVMEFPDWAIQTFFIGMYTQITAMAFFVVKGLFPTPKTDSLTAIREMVMNNSESNRSKP